MTTVIPASADTIIISIEYAPNGLDWARLYDNLCLGWTVSEVVPTAQKPGTPTAALSGHHRHLAGRGAGHCASDLAAMGEIHWSSRSGGYDSQLMARLDRRFLRPAEWYNGAQPPGMPPLRS
jgi:hypothetical protein